MLYCSLVGEVQIRIRHTKKHASLQHFMDFNSIHRTLKNQYQKSLHFLATNYLLATGGKPSSQGSTSFPLSLICLLVHRMIVHFMLAIDRKLFLTIWRDTLLSSSYCSSQWTWFHARMGKMLIITISHFTSVKELLVGSVRRSVGYWWICCYGSLW